MTSEFPDLEVPGPDLSLEEIQRYCDGLHKIHVASDAFTKINKAELAFLPLTVFGESAGINLRSLDKDGAARLLERHPNIIEEIYADIGNSAASLGISNSQYSACVNGIKRSVASGKLPTPRLREVFNNKWQEEERKLQDIPPSFRKTLNGALINLWHRPNCIPFLVEFMEQYPDGGIRIVDELVDVLRRNPISDFRDTAFFEEPQKYAAYALAKRIAPDSNVDLIAEVEEDVGRYLTDCISAWSSFLDNPIGRSVEAGPRQHYYGPSPSVREVSILLYYICSTSPLRQRFRTPLIELLRIAVRMQDAGGAWTAAFAVRSESRDSSVRDECTLSTVVSTQRNLLRLCR